MFSNSTLTRQKSHYRCGWTFWLVNTEHSHYFLLGTKRHALRKSRKLNKLGIKSRIQRMEARFDDGQTVL